MNKIKKEYLKKQYVVKKEYQIKCLDFLLDSAQVSIMKKISIRHTKQLALNKRKSKASITAVCLLTGHQKSRLNWGKLSRHAYKKEADSGIFTTLHKKSK